MESLSLQNFISLIIVFVSWLLVIFLLTAKTKNKTSNIILALFLIVNAQDSSGLFAHFLIYPKFPGWGMMINSTVDFKLPLLYLYIQSVVYADFKFKKIHLFHLTAWILNTIVLTPRFYAVDFDAKWAFLNAIDFRETIEIRLSYIIVHIQIFVYFIMSFILIKKYKTLLLENYSNASLFNYKWLYQLVFLFAVIAFIATFKNMFLFLHLENILFYTKITVSFIALGFMCWFVLKVMHSPEIFRGVNSNLQLVKSIVQEGQQIREEDSIESPIIVALKKHMVEEKPYLNATLTIEDLSKQINFETKDLSILINHQLNQHFFDFINGYRIRKAMDILKDPEKNELTILEILYKVGFNSKSSFNTAFKKYTKLTPTQFRKRAFNNL
ncbi:AraC family transcriptional regulator [Gaetbulibacter aquiaggeris]|uniref:AraC family transcriptional regulator n=1 Tax=Gaetbulibacter aquiaggeris TaxID=1735373 RepID=A0ABW7MMW0_9FLAO